MKPQTAQKLRDAEVKTGLLFPKKLFDLIRKLEDSSVMFGEEEWIFPDASENSLITDENFIITSSDKFYQNWKLKALVFAINEKGDHLLCLQDKDRKVHKQIFILISETDEIKVFNYSVEKLLEYGPVDYSEWDDYYLKLNNGEVITGDEIITNGTAENN